MKIPGPMVLVLQMLGLGWPQLRATSLLNATGLCSNNYFDVMLSNHIILQITKQVLLAPLCFQLYF